MLMNESINQSVNQSINQSISESINTQKLKQFIFIESNKLYFKILSVHINQNICKQPYNICYNGIYCLRVKDPICIKPYKLFKKSI